MTELLMGESLQVDLQKPSLVSFYLELPKSVSAMVEFSKIKGTYRNKFTTDTLNQNVDNFLKVKDFKHLSII